MWHYDKAKVGERIRAQRKALGLTQDELAERIGKTTKTCADVERGTCGMSIETMLNMCSVLNISPNTLLLDEPLGHESDIKHIEELLAGCTPSQQERVRKMLSLFLDK